MRRTLVVNGTKRPFAVSQLQSLTGVKRTSGPIAQSDVALGFVGHHFFGQHAQGMPGNSSERDEVVTARARNLPARICTIISVTGANEICTWPPIRSAVKLPRYAPWKLMSGASGFQICRSWRPQQESPRQCATFRLRRGSRLGPRRPHSF